MVEEPTLIPQYTLLEIKKTGLTKLDDLSPVLVQKYKQTAALVKPRRGVIIPESSPQKDEGIEEITRKMIDILAIPGLTEIDVDWLCQHLFDQHWWQLPLEALAGLESILTTTLGQNYSERKADLWNALMLTPDELLELNPHAQVPWFMNTEAELANILAALTG